MENRSTAANPTGTLCLIAIYDLSVMTSVNGNSTFVWKSTSDVISKSESHDFARTTLAMIPATPLSMMRNARHGAVPGRTVCALAAAPGIRRSSRRTSPVTLKKQRMPEIESGRLDCDARRNTARPIWTQRSTHVKMTDYLIPKINKLYDSNFIQRMLYNWLTDWLTILYFDLCISLYFILRLWCWAAFRQLTINEYCIVSEHFNDLI